MAGEINDQHPPTRLQHPGCLGDHRTWPVCVMQYHVDCYQIVTTGICCQTIHIAQPHLTVPQPAFFQTGPSHRQHVPTKVDTDRTIRAISKDFQHPTGTGADIQVINDRQVVAHL